MLNIHSFKKAQVTVTNRRRQTGVTLIEVMIALALSLVVTGSMVALMSNSLGSASRIIQMSQLTDELRNAMSMMTRDVRRANYSAHAAYCYANSDCGVGTDTNSTSSNLAKQADDILIDSDNCFIFGLDRDWDGDASNDDAGGFRIWPRQGGAGVVQSIEMWVGDNSPDCTKVDVDWVAVTDPDFVNITNFAVNDDASFEQSILEEDSSTLTLRSRQIQIQLEGNLILDATITRRIDDVIKIRNDLLSHPAGA